MSYRISHAQNFEDVLLWRALGHVARGRYVDIGAQSATVDSVSRLFHDAGWTGVHVEPVEAYAAELRAARPGDVVVQAAVSDTPGLLSFHRIQDTGLSTLSADVAASHADRGFASEEVVVPAITLDDVFARAGEGDIHWLKIDVEGAEADVLRSWHASPARPWVLVIEATQPMDETPSFEAWEPLVLAKGYKHVWFDGLNRFYVSDAHPELLEKFGTPLNVFDRFAMGPDASTLFGAEFRAQVADAKAQADARVAQADARIADGVRERNEAAATHHAAMQQAEAHLQATHALHAKQLEIRDVELAKLAKAVTDSQSHHAWERDVWRQERAALEQQLADRAAAERSWEATARLRKQQLDTVYASTSWKLTAPVRGVKYFAQALLRRARGEAPLPAPAPRIDAPVAAIQSATNEATPDPRATLSRRGRLAAALLDGRTKDAR